MNTAANPNPKPKNINIQELQKFQAVYQDHRNGLQTYIQ